MEKKNEQTPDRLEPRMRLLSSIAATLFTLLAAAFPAHCCLGLQPQAPGPVSGSEPVLPDGKGKTELKNTCSQCHALNVIAQKRRTKQEWSTIVDQMQERGAQATDEQVDLIIGYLAAHFGKLIYINQASAEDIQDAFAMTPQEAAAMLKYRQESGNFKNLDDLLNMPGVDAQKIRKQSDNIVFGAP
jgi:competence ComEA-like helix-hairpin-helix protein